MITSINEFRKYINEQLENVILYHGSKHSFTEFDDSMMSTGEGGDLFGKGFYLTNNKDIASFYGKQHVMKDHILKYNSGIFGTEVPVFKPGAEEIAEKDAKINTFKLNGNIGF